jgi:phospholipid transport system substrate-binding protein
MINVTQIKRPRPGAISLISLISLISSISLISLTTLTAAPALARPAGTATDAIRNANTRLRELLSQKVDKGSDAERKQATQITTEMRDLFDIGDLTRRALVDQWGKMTPAQRTAVVDTLRQIVERNYLSQLRSNLAYQIEYGGEEPRGEDVLVKTVVKAQRRGRAIEIPVEYLLHAEGDHWRAYDVVTDGVGLVDNYRSQFNRIIAKEGPGGLIARMKAKLERGE